MPSGTSENDGWKVPLVFDEEDEEEEVWKRKEPDTTENKPAATYTNLDYPENQLPSPSSPNDTFDQIFSDRLHPQSKGGGGGGDAPPWKMDLPNNNVPLDSIPNIHISAASSSHSVRSDATQMKEQLENYCMTIEQC